MVARMDGSGGGDEDGAPSFSDETLIAWHAEPLSGAELARREGVALRWLNRQWDRLRRTGKIARGGRNVAGMNVPPARIKASYEIDGRPSVGLIEDDPLLARLVAVHGEPRWDLVDVKGRRRGDVRQGGRRG